jgi:hypothetical protein
LEFLWSSILEVTMKKPSRSVLVLFSVLLAGCLVAWLAIPVNLKDSKRQVLHQVINGHRKLQSGNPFAGIGAILIRLINIIVLIFGGPRQTLAPTPAPAPTGTFNIRLQYDSSVPASHRFMFEEAKVLFQKVITRDIENVPLSALTDTVPEAPGCTYSDVDDIDICVYYTPDVAFGVGGYNNRRFSGPNAPLPSTGSIAINSSLEADEVLRDLIVHEMAHALVRIVVLSF